MYFVIVYNRPPAQKQKREFSIEDPFSFCKNKKTPGKLECLRWRLCGSRLVGRHCHIGKGLFGFYLWLKK